jgi:hypothetical protein
MAGSFLESYVQIQKEVTWGTAVTTGMFKIPTLSWDVNPAYDIYTSQMITGAAGESAPTFGVKRVAGRWTLEAGYGGMDHFMYGVLGSGSNVSGVGPFLNRYVPSAAMPSFTCHASYGNVPTGKVIEFQGVKFSAVEMSGDATQGFMSVAADLLAEEALSTGTTGVTAGTVAATGAITHNPIEIQPAGSVTTLDIGVGASEAYCVRAFNIRIDRQLSASRICLGVDTIKEPVPTVPMSVTGTFVVEWEAAHLNIFDALTLKTVHSTTQLKWTAGTNSFDVVFPKLVYTSISTPIQQGDTLVSTLGWKAYGTAGTGATAEPLNVTIDSPIDFDVL